MKKHEIKEESEEYIEDSIIEENNENRAQNTENRKKRRSDESDQKDIGCSAKRRVRRKQIYF